MSASVAREGVEVEKELTGSDVAAVLLFESHDVEIPLSVHLRFGSNAEVGADGSHVAQSHLVLVAQVYSIRGG
jgi:hypothetical protein